MDMISRNSIGLARALQVNGFEIALEDHSLGAIVLILPIGYIFVIGINENSDKITISYQIPVAKPNDELLLKVSQGYVEYPGVKIVGTLNEQKEYVVKIELIVYSGLGIPLTAIFYALDKTIWVAKEINIT